MTYTINYPMSTPFSFSPYNGPDIMKTSYFESNDPIAFSWIAKDSVLVPVPQVIDENEIYLSQDKKLYGAITRTPYIKENDDMVTLEIPGNKVNFYLEPEYRKRTVSYQLTLINNRTQDEKLIEGKWIETTPTGKFNIVKDW